MLYVGSQHIKELLGVILQYENVVFNGEQEIKSIFCVRTGKKNLSLTTTVSHHLASLMMPNSDPRDGFYYPILTRMIDSYIIT